MLFGWGDMTTRILILSGVLAMTFTFPAMVACVDVPRGSADKNDLAGMRTAPIAVEGRTSFTAYVADSDQTRQIGLMNVTEGELPDDRGMIFVFPGDQPLSFWMRNTLIPLDIAYIRSDGVIVKTYTMEPLNEMSYPSIEAAQFALEVNAGQFDRWGIQPGDRVTIPDDLISD